MAAIRIDMILQDVNNSIGRRTQAVQNLNTQLQRTQQLSQNTTTSGSQVVGYNRARGVGAGSTGSESRDFAAQAQGLGGVVRLYATFAANIFAVSAAFKALQQASNFENLIESSKRMTLATGVDLTALSKNLQEASNYALSLEESMQFANIGTSAGIAAKQVTSLVQIARGAAVGLGRDVQDSIRRIIQGTAKQEQEILDELGIFIKSKKAYEDFAKKFGIEGGADALTAQQRVAAYADAVEKAGEKWKDFAEIDDPFSRIAASGKSAVQDILTSINDIIRPILSLLAESKEAIKGIILLIGGMLTLRALPELKSIFSNIFFYNRDLAKKQAEIARNQIRQELSTTNAEIAAQQAQLQRTILINTAGQVNRQSIGSALSQVGIGLGTGTRPQGISTQALGTRILGGPTTPKDLSRYTSVAQIEDQILKTLQKQAGTSQQKLDTLIRTKAVEQGSLLTNIKLSQESKAAAQAIFASIQTTNAGLSQEAAIRTTISNLQRQQITQQATLNAMAPGAVQPLQRLVPNPSTFVGPQRPTPTPAPAPAAAGAAGAAAAGAAAGAAAAAVTAAGSAAGWAAKQMALFSTASAAVAGMFTRLEQVAGASFLTKMRSVGVVLLDVFNTIRGAGSAAVIAGAAFRGLVGGIGLLLRGALALAPPFLLLYSLWSIFGEKLFPSIAATRELNEANKNLVDTFAKTSTAVENAGKAYAKTRGSAQEYLKYIEIINNATQSQIDSINALITKEREKNSQEKLKAQQDLAKKQGAAPPTALSLGLSELAKVPELYSPEQLNIIEKVTSNLRTQTSLIETGLATRIKRAQDEVRAKYRIEQQLLDERRLSIINNPALSEEGKLEELQREQNTQLFIKERLQKELQEVTENIGKTTEATKVALTETTEQALKLLMAGQARLQQLASETNLIITNGKKLDDVTEAIRKKMKGIPKLTDIVSTEEARTVAETLDSLLNPKTTQEQYSIAINTIKEKLKALSAEGVPEAETALQIFSERLKKSDGDTKKLFETLKKDEIFKNLVIAVETLTEKYSEFSKGVLQQIEEDLLSISKQKLSIDLSIQGADRSAQAIRDLLGYVDSTVLSRQKNLQLQKIEQDTSEKFAKAEQEWQKISLDVNIKKETTAYKNGKAAYELAKERIASERDYAVIQAGIADQTREIENSLAAINKKHSIKSDIQKTEYQITSDILDLQQQQISAIASLDGLHYSTINNLNQQLAIQKASLTYANELKTIEADTQKAKDDAAAKSTAIVDPIERAVALNTARNEADEAAARRLALAGSTFEKEKTIADIMRQQADIAGRLKEVLQEIDLIEEKRSLRADIALEGLELELQIAEARSGKPGSADRYTAMKKETDLRKVDLKYENDMANAIKERDKALQKIYAEEEQLGELTPKMVNDLVAVLDVYDLRAEKAVQLKDKTLELIDSTDYLTERQQGYEQIFTSSFDRMGDAMVEFAKTGKLSFKGMIESMLEDIIRFEIKQANMAMWQGGMRDDVFGFLRNLFPGSQMDTSPVSAFTSDPFVLPGSFAKGGAFDYGMMKFAKGGMFTNSIVDQPTTFKFAKGVGLMGEAGPEAIMPLKRDSSGNLGVRAQGGETKVVVNNYSGEKAEARETTDSRGNRKIEVIVGDMVAGEVSRGGSSSNKAMKSTFGLKPQLIRR